GGWGGGRAGGARRAKQTPRHESEQGDEQDSAEAVTREEITEQSAEREAAERRHPACKPRRLGLPRRSSLVGSGLVGRRLLRGLGRRGRRWTLRHASLHAAAARPAQARSVGALHDEQRGESESAETD